MITIAWWGDLSSANQIFYILAAFFSLIFLWQLISSLIGLSGGDVDMDVDVGADFGTDIEADSLGDAADSVAVFKLVSIRALLAFGTLFCWATALYMDTEVPVSRALLYATGWGLAGWVVVSLLVHWIRTLAETGTARLTTAVGSAGTVYLDIPADGVGEARVSVSGVVTMVRARTAGEADLAAGTAIRVVRLLNETTVEVQPIGVDEQRRDEEQ